MQVHASQYLTVHTLCIYIYTLAVCVDRAATLDHINQCAESGSKLIQQHYLLSVSGCVASVLVVSASDDLVDQHKATSHEPWHGIQATL
jgi:hypothetical protein